MQFYSQFQIHYVLALPETELEGFSPFQGFSIALLERNMIFRQIVATLPPTVLELFNPSVAALQQRFAGVIPYSVLPLDAKAFKNLNPNSLSPFVVVFVDSETSNEIKEWAQGWPLPVWLIDMGAPIESCLTKPNLKAYCSSVAEALRQSDPDHYLLHVGDWQTCPSPDDVFDVPFKSWHHNTTVPNEAVMLSIGCHERTVEKPLVGKNEVYVTAIIQSVRSVLKLRQVIPETSLYKYSPPLYSLILTSPGLYHDVRTSERSKDPSLRAVSDVVRYLQSQQTYSTMIERDRWQQFVENPHSKPIYFIRSQELNAMTSALCVRAAAHLSPVLRLPPAIDHVMGSVTRLRDCLGAFRPKLFKVRKAAKHLFEDIENRVDPRFVDLIDSPHSHVKIVSDAPLEWLPVRGLPLMLRKITSRIPVTPGNLSLLTVLPRPPIRLSMRDFSETLVIRSFPDDDPIRPLLQEAIFSYRLDDQSSLPVRIVDVKTREDVVHALNSFQGALVIFDCHGSHRKDEEVATLQLAGEKLDFWDIRTKVRMPPIVFTCACDTHSAGRSHATCGNGLLFCGAQAVIASVLPVSGGEAAIFAARLLFRIYQLLPRVTGEEPGWTVRWDGVISLLQRMMFVSELFLALQQHLNLGWNWGTVTQTECTSIIHNSGSEWYELVLEAIAKDSNLTIAELDEIRNQYLPFPHTLRYLHMGNPELILIGPESVDLEEFGVFAEPDPLNTFGP